MTLSDILFDVLAFGALLAAVACDALVPATHGAATLIVLGFLLYLAAEDGAAIGRRFGWGQESLASGLALSTFGFIYYWWRNNSDTAATALHICLMLSALMALIGIVAAFAAAMHERSARPIIGLIVTLVVAFLLGIVGGLTLLFLTSGAALAMKVAVIVVGVVVWRVFAQMRKGTVENAPAAESPDAALAVSRLVKPARGTTLDRLAPLLVLGALAFAVFR
ncbi:MAG TPA: hypothetical protein VF681_08785 [Abditibacteriaceae bacterium]|jgi:uncharacterized membrane protein